MKQDIRAAERTRERLLQEALRLFALRSFAGTSLQMIADNLGVTKAAIYHHFKTRDEILTAVIQPGLEEMRATIAHAEAQRTPASRADAMLTGFVQLTVKHRELIAMIGTDPGVTQALNDHPDIKELISRPAELLAEASEPPGGELNAIVALSGIASTASSPLHAHLDPQQLSQHLIATGRRILGLRPRRTLSQP